MNLQSKDGKVVFKLMTTVLNDWFHNVSCEQYSYMLSIERATNWIICETIGHKNLKNILQICHIFS